VQHRDRYTRLDVTHNIRAMIRIFEERALTIWARRYRTLLHQYTPEQDT